MNNIKRLFIILGIIILSLIITLIVNAVYHFNLTYFLIFLGSLIVIFTVSADTIIFKNKENYQFNVNLIISLISLSILFGQLQMFSIQTSILNTQTQILEESSISNQPDVLIVSSQGYRCYNLNDYLNVGKEGWIAIGLTNIGKATIPSLNVQFIHQNNISGMLEKDNFFGLDSLEYNYTWVRWNFEDVDISNFKFGVRDLTFVIDCPVCKSPTKYQNVPICIYNNSREECGEPWGKYCY